MPYGEDGNAVGTRRYVVQSLTLERRNISLDVQARSSVLNVLDFHHPEIAVFVSS